MLNQVDPNTRISKYSPTLSRSEEVFRIFYEVIEALDGEALNEFYSGYDGDMAGLMDDIEEEIFKCIYGNGKINVSHLSYLSNLTEQIEETLRVENLTYFITSILPEFDLGWHHVEWAELVQRHKYLDIIAARDHGKSYFFSNAYIIWKMFRYRPNNGFDRRRTDLYDKKGMLFSFTIGQGRDLLTILKDTIESNDILRKKLMPTSKTDGWAAESITCKNGSTLKVKGFGSSIRGSHPHYIVVDDPLKDNVIYSTVQRRKSIEYFHSVIMNAIVPGKQVIVVGTPFHNSDLHADLKSKMIVKDGKSSGWFVREYPSLFPDGRVLWPGRYSFADLMEKKKTQGNLIFSREHLCKPIVSDASIFPYDLIQRCHVRMDNVVLTKNRESFAIKMKRITLGCDFGISQSIGADYSCFATIGQDENDIYWLMNLTRLKGKSFAEQIATIKSLHSSFQYDVINMESNVFQMIFVQEADRQGLPVVSDVTTKNKNDFKDGLPGLTVVFEQGKFKMPRGNQESIDTTDLVGMEFSSIAFTDKGLASMSEHDDIVFSVWKGVRGHNLSAANGFRFSFL